MPTLVDSSIWIDYFRPKTPRSIKEQAAAVITQRDAVICEPIRFELLRGASRETRDTIKEYLATVPMLGTPENLWQAATALGEKCTERGLSMAGIDLLIAQIAIQHGAEIVTFDSGFSLIAKVSNLRARVIDR
jgi:predicted nucleic acid-binding protein